MKNIYRITKGQLFSILFFGIIGWIYTLDSYSDFSGFLSIFIPAVLVFYTIGWRANNKVKEEIKDEHSLNMSKILPSKKSVLTFIVITATIIAIIFGIYYLIDSREKKIQKEKLTLDYNQAILKVDDVKEQLVSCIKPVYEKKYQEELRSCGLLKNKIKADYDFCLTYTSVSPRASCLYTYDYESIDCSEETLKKKSQSKITELDAPVLCRNLLHELEGINTIIEQYTKLNRNK